MLNHWRREEAQAGPPVEPIRKIVFACDAAWIERDGGLRAPQQAQEGGFEDVSVVNVAFANLEDSYDLVVTHQDLTLRARDRTPSAQHVSVTNFMASPKYDDIVQEVQQTNAAEGSSAPS